MRDEKNKFAKTNTEFFGEKIIDKPITKEKEQKHKKILIIKVANSLANNYSSQDQYTKSVCHETNKHHFLCIFQCVQDLYIHQNYIPDEKKKIIYCG